MMGSFSGTKVIVRMTLPIRTEETPFNIDFAKGANGPLIDEWSQQ